MENKKVIKDLVAETIAELATVELTIKSVIDTAEISHCDCDCMLESGKELAIARRWLHSANFAINVVQKLLIENEKTTIQPKPFKYQIREQYPIDKIR